ncbi:MAG: thioredoxin domain-containing protein [Desulfobulbaceae bacterium]
MLEHNPDTVKIVLKNLPLAMHQFADPAARTALAAGEQGKFWEFHDALFALPAINNETIEGIAIKLGLKIEQFKRDMASPKIRQKLDQDIMDAQQAGVSGTPTIFINGRLLREERSLESIQQKIDAALGKTTKK